MKRFFSPKSGRFACSRAGRAPWGEAQQLWEVLALFVSFAAFDHSSAPVSLRVAVISLGELQPGRCRYSKRTLYVRVVQPHSDAPMRNRCGLTLQVRGLLVSIASCGQKKNHLTRCGLAWCFHSSLRLFWSHLLQKIARTLQLQRPFSLAMSSPSFLNPKKRENVVAVFPKRDLLGKPEKSYLKCEKARRKGRGLVVLNCGRKE